MAYSSYNSAPALLPKPDECRFCPLWSVTHFQDHKLVTYTGEGFCKPEGYPALGVAFVAEASGRNEEEEGLPLRPYAQAGSIHTRVLRTWGVSRKQVLAFNVLSCRPPNNKLEGSTEELSAISHCAAHREPRLRAFVESCQANPMVKTPVIVALGAVAFRTLTGLVGDKLGISYTRGYPIQTPYGIVVGTFHPAEVRRKIKHIGVLTEDYGKAFMYAREGFREFPRNYTEYPTTTQKRDFRDRVKALAAANDPTYLAFDFETDDIVPEMHGKHDWPKIQSVQFSIAPGTGIFIDASEDWELMSEILGYSNRKVTHNGWDFDVPLADFWNLKIGGIVDDSLWMFHHLQPDLVMDDASADLDGESDYRFSTSASLQFVASFFGMDFIWKHFRKVKEKERFYGIADVDADSRICAPGTGLPDRMRRYGVWDGYERYVREFYPVLKKMADRGIPINRHAQAALHSDLAIVEREIDQRIQKIHPDILKSVAPQSGYVNGPKEGPKIKKVYLDGV